VPFFVQLLQLPAVVVVERVRARRAICVWTSGIGRGFLLAAAFAPLVAASAGIGALIAFLAVHQGMAAVSGCSWNSWMRDLVPESEQGRFFGRRTAAATALATVLVLLGGGFVELWKVYIPASPVIGYSLLFALSAAIGLFGVYLLSITPDRPMPPVVGHVHPLHLIWGPFRDANFRRLVTFLASCSFAVNLHDYSADHGKPVEQPGRTWALGPVDRSLQQQGGACCMCAALPGLHVRLDIDGTAFGSSRSPFMRCLAFIS
jgi:hypothetical protein